MNNVSSAGGPKFTITQLLYLPGYREVDTMGLQVKLKVPELKTPKMITYNKNLMSAVTKKVSKEQQNQLQIMYVK